MQFNMKSILSLTLIITTVSLYSCVSIPRLLLKSGLNSSASMPTSRINQSEEKIDSICIFNNPKVTIPGFKDEIIRQLKLRNITVYESTGWLDSNEGLCNYTLKYTASKSWDIVSYTGLIELILYSNSTRYPVGNVFYKIPNIISADKLSADSDNLIAPVLNNMMPLNQQVATSYDITISEEEDFRKLNGYHSITINYLSSNPIDGSESMTAQMLMKGNLS